MMFRERFILRNLSRLYVSRNPVSFLKYVSCRRQRFFHTATVVDREILKPVSISLCTVCHFAQQVDFLKATFGEKGFVKESILRGEAATEVQESLLSEFIEKSDEARPEEWKSLLNKIFELQHGMIHETNIDGRVLEMCYVAQNLPLARSYLNFQKSIGKKFNSVSVCGFIKICHECQSSMTKEDQERIQSFTKYLMTKHKILDSITTDAVVKGLILCGLGQETFRILEEVEKLTVISSSTHAAMASYLIKNNEPGRAMEYFRLIVNRNQISHHKIFVEWIEFYKNDPQKLTELLLFFRDVDLKPSKEICDHLLAAYSKLPRPLALEGVYGHVKNSGECSVCQRPLKRLDLYENEFNEMRESFLQTALVGNDIFKHTTPEELLKFVSFVEENGPFDIILDGLNVAYMSGTSVTPNVFVGLVRGVVRHFHDHGNKILLIGKEHMSQWPNFLSTLNEFNVKHFFIADISEDDLYIIYSTLYSGLDAYFVTRDLLRAEKFELSEKHRTFFKRWQQSHQIFVTYVTPSGKAYMKTPISFQMTVQKTSSGGWHIPYTDDNVNGPAKDEYEIHRKWLCLDRYLS